MPLARVQTSLRAFRPTAGAWHVLAWYALRTPGLLGALGASAPSAPIAARAQEAQDTAAPPTQAGPPAERESECYGFSFGAWRPPLDWRAAGHPPSVEPHHTPSAARSAPRSGGQESQNAPPPESAIRETREGASEDAPPQPAGAGTPDGLVLTLFPSWWPVGVSVRLPRPPELADTVAGEARAFVADGRVASPTSAVRAWRVACSRR